MITVTKPEKIDGPNHQPAEAFYASVVRNECSDLIVIRIVPISPETYKVILRHPSGHLIRNIPDTVFDTLEEALDAGKRAAASIIRSWAIDVEATL